MNKQGLIERIEGLKNLFGNKVECIEIDAVIELVSKLDESQKVKVPPFVADWIEEARKTCKDVADLFDLDFTNEEVGKWFMQEQPFDLVARAWLDGYEVEKEKRYVVKVKGNIKENMLVYGEFAKRYFFTKNSSVFNVRYSHTRKELEEAGFGWVFDCEGIEIEEVQE